KLEPATEADAVHARDQRNRQQLHETQEVDADEPAALVALSAAAGRNTRLENVEICAGGEMPQAAADHDGAACRLLCRLDRIDDRVDEFWAEQIVRPVLHGQDGDIAALLARDECVLGQGNPPLLWLARGARLPAG